jgi:hypothetical protein
MTIIVEKSFKVLAHGAISLWQSQNKIAIGEHALQTGYVTDSCSKSVEKNFLHRPLPLL